MSVEVTKLPSGLTVVTDTMPHLETAALGVWAGVGGRDEKPNEHGISHLLEHMAFKGTTRRRTRPTMSCSNISTSSAIPSSRWAARCSAPPRP